jgi:hypothetical protein
MAESEPFSELDSKNVHTHTFWLYSVIVGLSVEEALRHVLPHVGELSLTMPVDKRVYIATEFVRLALYILLVVRFYLGAVRFFFHAHTSDASKDQYPRRSYTYDFFFGLVHFSAFLALSLTIDAEKPEGVFLFWLSFILLYDFIWWLTCRKFDTSKLIKFWTFVNGLTFVLSMALYVISTKLTNSLPEYWAMLINDTVFMLPVFIVSFLDLREVLNDEPIFQNWFLKLVSRK